MTRIEICKNIIQSIKDYITNPTKIEAHRVANHFVRKRKLSMLHVINYLLYSSKASMYNNLSSIINDLPVSEFPNITKQALSKARQFINFPLFRELFNLSVDTFYSSIENRKTWQGYHLFAIDGSRIELPCSESNYEYFGKMYTIKDDSGNKKYYTQGLTSIIYDVLEDYIVHASLGPYLSAERSAAKEHLATLERLNLHNNSVIIFDRGYYSTNMFQYCINHGHYCVMRLKETILITKKALKDGDVTTTINVGDDKKPIDINIRVIKVILPDGSNEFLATNIFDKAITADMFKELYFKRWPIEIKYKELKTRFQIEEFNGATKNSIFQEFFINLLLSNLSSLIKNQADDHIDSNNKSTNKYRYQSNRSFIIGRVKKIFPRIICGELDLVAIDLIYEYALNTRSQLQPGRSFKRSKSVRHRRTHFRNMKSAL